MGTWILWAILLGMLAWMGFNYFRIRRAAKVVDNSEFEGLIRQGQLIDLRDPSDFHRKHILGRVIFRLNSSSLVSMHFAKTNQFFFMKIAVGNV